MSSSGRYRALKGMQDILPPDVHIWQHAESAAREVFSIYGFRQVRMPIVEQTELFARSIGEDTDIVEKEMYTFTDKGGRSVTLRPEGTASVVRGFVEHSLQTLPSPQKFYYAGPMFRYERPQAGRFRQFHQIGVEALGDPHPRIDAEVIAMLRRFLGRLGLGEVRIEVNSIGCEACRPAYREELLRFFSGSLDGLCPDCNRRFERNPMRILDCKVPRCVEIRKGAPRVTDFLCGECRSHFEELLSLLDLLEVPYRLNPEMVRGLDYYTRTTFEATSTNLGAQSAVAAGGRYDRLVKEFGGPDTPAVGFAVGMERMVELLRKVSPAPIPTPDAFLAVLGPAAGREGLVLAEGLRNEGLWVELGDGSSLKSQLRRADRLSAGYVLILGDEEIGRAVVKWKRLSDGAQGEVGLADVPGFLCEGIQGAAGRGPLLL